MKNRTERLKYIKEVLRRFDMDVIPTVWNDEDAFILHAYTKGNFVLSEFYIFFDNETDKVSVAHWQILSSCMVHEHTDVLHWFK